MGQAISVFLPMLLFMMLPMLIPVVTGLAGRVYDRVAGARQEQSPAARATEAARQATAARRAETVARHRAVTG